MVDRYVMRAESVWDASAGYRIVDLRRRAQDAVAYISAADDAQRIVDLLNADERLKEQARMGVRKETV